MLKPIVTGLNCFKEKTENKVFRHSVLLLIIALQLLLMGFWTTQKSNYYIDEMFSMGYAHTYIHPKEDVVYINHSNIWENEKWIDNTVLKEQLITTKEDALFTLPFQKALRKLFLGRNYMGMLNMVMSAFSPGQMSRYPGILMNFVLFFFTQLLLYRISKEMTGSFGTSVMAVAMYGFSAMAIGLAIYIRFYTWVIFLLTAAIRIHQKMWKSGDLLKCELGTIVSMSLIYLALKNSELVFIIGGALIGFYFLGLLVSRQYKKSLLYFITIVPASLFYAVKKTPFVDMILHPADYLGREGPMGWMTKELLSISSGKLLYFARLYKRWLDEQMTGSKLITFSYLIVLLILLEVKLFGGKAAVPDGEKGTEHTTKRQNKEKNGSGFGWIILSVELVYLLFCFLTSLPATRYVSFLFPFIPVLLWTALSKLTQGSKNREIVLSGCALLVMLGFGAGMIHPERIEYIYMGDRPLIASLQERGIADSVVLYTNEEDATHVVYDCVNLMPDNARVYPVQKAHHHMDTDGFPEEALVWVKNGENVHECLTDIETTGYHVTWLGKTHCSDVYVASRTAP